MTSPSTILTALHALAGRAGEADLATWLLDERRELEHAWSLGDQNTLPFRAPPGPPFLYLTLARPFYPDRGLSGGTVVDHSTTGRRVSGLHGTAVGNDIVSFPFYPSDEATLTAQMMPLASDGGPLYPSLAAWEAALGRRLEQAEREWNAGALREALEVDLLRNERIDLLARVNSLDNYLMASKDIATAWLVARLTASLNGGRNEHKLIDTLWSSKALWDDTVGQSLTRIYHLVRQRDESPTSLTVAPVGDLGQEKAQLRDRLHANLAEMMDLLNRAGPVGSRAEARVYEPLEGAPTRAQIENKYNTVEDLREHLEASEAALAGARRAFQDAHRRMPSGSVASVSEEEPPAVESGVLLHDTIIVGWGDRVRDEDYPYGRGERTTAEWTVERSAQHGERICRTTLHPKSGRPGAPKCSTYGQRAKLGHGANGRVYGLVERRAGGSADVILGTMELGSYVRRSTDTARYDALMLAAFGDSVSTAPASKAPVDDAREKMMDTIWERTAKDMRAGSKKDRNREVTARSPEGGASIFKLDQGSREDVVYVFRQKVGEAAESSPSADEVVARLRNELDHLFAGYRWSVRALSAFGHNGVMISFYRAHPNAPAAEGLADRDQGSWGYENAPYIIRVSVEAAPGFKWKPGENAPARLKLRTVELSGRDVWGGRPLEGVKPRAVTGPPDKVIEATSAWFSANADLIKGSGPGKPFPDRLTNRGPSGPAPRALAQLAERAGLADLVEWLRTQGALLRVSGPLATLTPRRSRGVPGGSCEAPAPTCGATVEAHVRANPSINEAVRELGRSLARPAVDALVARLEREGVRLEAPARLRLDRAVETALSNPSAPREPWHTSALQAASVQAVGGPLGIGWWGAVYALDDGRVVKLTSSPEEVAMWADLAPRYPDVFPRVDRLLPVGELPAGSHQGDQTVWAVVREAVSPFVDWNQRHDPDTVGVEAGYASTQYTRDHIVKLMRRPLQLSGAPDGPYFPAAFFPGARRSAFGWATWAAHHAALMARINRGNALAFHEEARHWLAQISGGEADELFRALHDLYAETEREGVLYDLGWKSIGETLHGRWVVFDGEWRAYGR